MKVRTRSVGWGLLVVLVLLGGRATAAMMPPPRDPGDDPRVNCLGDTTASFQASADTIEWGQSVTVSWSRPSSADA